MARRLVLTILLVFGYIAAQSLGLKLFSPEMRSAASYPHQVVMNFIERYFTELVNVRHTSIETKMADDKVYFRKGKPADLELITDTMPFSINLLDSYYEVKWMRQDYPFVTLVFPAQYDLLLGMSQQQAQQSFRDSVLVATKQTTMPASPKDLQQDGDSIFVSKAEIFELQNLNNALYYTLVEDSLQPVFDNAHIDYSAANLFHGLIEDVDYRLYVEQSVYGLKTINYTIPLRQWLYYCKKMHLKVFFAVEEEREDGIKALVVAQSVELGFAHLLSVVIPNKFISDKDVVLKAKITPYIPQHNIKNLYQQQTTNSKKKVWQ